MVYLDTSIIVSALTREVNTQRSTQWLTAQPAGALIVSPWVEIEFMSAIGMKLRLNSISQDDWSVARSAYLRLMRDYCSVRTINAGHYKAAAEVLADHGLGLRSGDALHIAIVATDALSLCTLDQAMFDAGRALGIDTMMP